MNARTRRAISLLVDKAMSFSSALGELKQRVAVVTEMLRNVVTTQVHLIMATESIVTAQTSMTTASEDLLAQYELLAEQYVLLTEKYNEQQATNAELYSMIIQLANAMRERGIDMKFPNLEFEVGKSKKSDPGMN